MMYCERRLKHSIEAGFWFPDHDAEEHVVDLFGREDTNMPTKRDITWELLSHRITPSPPGEYDSTGKLLCFIETSSEVQAIFGNDFVIEYEAGIISGSGHVPFHSKYGVPIDASEMLMDNARRAPHESFGYSWLTLREIEQFDWDKCIMRSGFVSIKGWCQYKKFGRPKNWLNSVYRYEKIVDQSKMDEWISKYDIDCDNMSELIHLAEKFRIKDVYCQIEWSQSYKDMGKSFLDTVVKYLQENSGGNSNNVRIVYWFR